MLEAAHSPGEGYNVALHEFAHYLEAEGLGLAATHRDADRGEAGTRGGLIADDAAEDATGEKNLITRYVLADIFAPKDAPAAPVPTAPDEPSGRGLARRWRSD